MRVFPFDLRVVNGAGCSEFLKQGVHLPDWNTGVLDLSGASQVQIILDLDVALLWQTTEPQTSCRQKYGLKREGIAKLVSKFHLLESHHAQRHSKRCGMYYRKHICPIAFKFNTALTIWEYMAKRPLTWS